MEQRVVAKVRLVEVGVEETQVAMMMNQTLWGCCLVKLKGMSQTRRHRELSPGQPRQSGHVETRSDAVGPCTNCPP